MRKLYDAIQACINEASGPGQYVRTADIRTMLRDRFPDVIREVGENLQAIGLSRVLESRVKRSRSNPMEEHPTLFPDELQKVASHLPGMISIPRKMRTLSEDDRESDIDWKATLEASLTDLRLHLDFLEECITRDQRCFEHIQLFYFYLEPLMRDNPDRPIKEVLARISSAQKALHDRALR